MTGSKRPELKATARSLVLYNPNGLWRFAIYNDAGIIDGTLSDASAGVEAAQAQLLRDVEEMTEQRYVVRWKQDKPHWWSADLVVES